MTTFSESKMTKMTLTKMTACYVFSELFLCGVKNKSLLRNNKSKAIWNRCGVLNITRWLQWNYCPLPTASCKVISKPFLSSKCPLLHTKSCRMSRVFYCLFLTVFTLIFVGCTTDEDPIHEVMRGYFDESQGLFLQNSDSISRFSCGIYV